MNGENQAEQDRKEQEQRQEQYKEEFLRDRARQNVVMDNYKTSGGIIGREAGKLADKETFKKFKGTLGEGEAKIKAQEHGVGGWVIGLVLAITKDLLDMATLESASWFDWLIDAMLGVGLFLLFGKSAKAGAKLIKSVGPTIFEMAPGIGFLPIWSISVAYMFFKSQQEEEE